MGRLKDRFIEQMERDESLRLLAEMEEDRRKVPVFPVPVDPGGLGHIVKRESAVVPTAPSLGSQSQNQEVSAYDNVTL